LKNLYIIFNGYWPENNAYMDTASFKELEAPSVLARVPENNGDTIVVASAGNTGRAFANICSRNGIPLVLVVPEASEREIWSTEPFNDNVKLVLASGNSDYYDAIHLAGKITNLDGFFPEGGAKNVARRDGMATTVLDASVVIERIPDHYFQAIGSGTGGIAAYESSLRLIESGGYDNVNMKLHLSQNHPFTPMTDAWNGRSKALYPLEEEEAKMRISQVSARVLSNRKPPYSITGGVYEVLETSQGHMYSVTNQEVCAAMELFEEKEGIDICPAAGVAVGSLLQAVEKKTIDAHDVVSLNITGGGEKKVKSENDIYYLEPFLHISDEEIRNDEIEHKLGRLVAAVC
jgi:cysteate synthase